MSDATYISSLDDYIKVRMLDNGTTANVYLYKHNYVPTPRKATLPRIPPRSKVCVVKQYKPDKERTNERDILLAIRRQITATNGGHSIVQLLGFDPSPSPQWLMMSTIPACCTLHELPVDKVLPPLFIWFVLKELLLALTFLQHECKPPIAHCDLHSSNVLVGFDNAGCTGPLRILLVDLGESDMGDNIDRLERDTWQLMRIVADLCGWGVREPPHTGCEGLDEFLRVWEAVEEERMGLDTLAEWFERVAMTYVEKMDGEVEEKIRVLVKDVVGRRKI
jgi:serine/threonine protein kinase